MVEATTGLAVSLRAAVHRVVEHRWTLGVWLGGVACLLVLVLPSGSPGWVVILNGASIVAVLVFLWAAIRMPRGARAVWWCLWVYLALTVAGDIVYDVYLYHFQQEPFPSPADGLYLSSYLGMIAGLVILVHRRESGRNRETWVDTAVMSLAAACVVATVVVMPMLSDSSASSLTTVVAVAYPVLDLVVMSVLIRLLIDVKDRNPALTLLAVAVACTLTADLAFQGLAAQGLVEDAPAWVDVLFLAAILLMTAAATARGAGTITHPSPGRHRTKARLVGLAVAALTAPTLLAVSVWSEVGSGARLLAVISIAVLLLILWGALMLISMVEQQSALLSDLARKDGLTGLPNRRTWDFELERVATRTAEQGVPLTVAMLDLDHFKDYNDRYGHPQGDKVLVDCTKAWHARLQPPTLLARYGGEEFAVLLPGADSDEAMRLLEHIRAATPQPQTVSIGCAQRTPGEPIQHTVERADQALYRAKAMGRDCVVVDDPAGLPLRG